MSSNQIKYALRRGNRIAGVDAETIGTSLAEINRKHGNLTAPVVVDEARPDVAPLHPCFEWDDSVAGEEYRRWQARNLIKSVHVIEEGKPSPSPVYVHVPKVSHAEAAYHSVDVVVDRPDMFAAALSQLVSKVRQAQDAVEALKHAAEQSEMEPERMARIAMAVQALATASAAVHALH